MPASVKSRRYPVPTRMTTRIFLGLVAFLFQGCASIPQEDACCNNIQRQKIILQDASLQDLGVFGMNVLRLRATNTSCGNVYVSRCFASLTVYEQPESECKKGFARKQTFCCFAHDDKDYVLLRPGADTYVSGIIDESLAGCLRICQDCLVVVMTKSEEGMEEPLMSRVTSIRLSRPRIWSTASIRESRGECSSLGTVGEAATMAHGCRVGDSKIPRLFNGGGRQRR